jgi:hypothetical protein
MKGTEKQKSSGIAYRIRNLLSGGRALKDAEMENQKLKLELRALQESVKVYERAVLNEREVAVQALRSLEKLNKKGV